MNIGHPSYSFFDHKSTVWIPVFLLLVLITTLVFYFNFPSGYNQGLYHYQGLVLKNGGLPYTDFIEKKGPMGLLTYALASLLFGETSMAYRFFDVLVLGVIAFFLFRLSSLYHSKLVSCMVVVFWLQHLLVDGPGNTGDVTNIITACYVSLAYHLLAPKKKNHYIKAGILIALACWVKPTAFLIAIPLILLLLDKTKEVTSFHWNVIFKILLGMSIPSIVFLMYLLISGTFYGFWESVVVDTIFNYTGHFSRFSTRTIAKVVKALLQDPLLRIGGLLGLFIFSKSKLLKLLVLGIGLMLFVEGRFYPYHFSILWPFVTLGIVEGFIVLSNQFSENKQKILVGLFSIIMVFPVFNAASTFLSAGFSTDNFKAATLFKIPAFKTMYEHRKPVVSYLKGQMHTGEEILVLGQDPNIYLELGAITSCRLAREGTILTKEPTEETPPHLLVWHRELLDYMQSQKANWIIVLKTLSNQWSDAYRKEINSIFSNKYELNHSTEGHLIYKKL